MRTEASKTKLKWRLRPVRRRRTKIRKTLEKKSLVYHLNMLKMHFPKSEEWKCSFSKKMNRTWTRKIQVKGRSLTKRDVGSQGYFLNTRQRGYQRELAYQSSHIPLVQHVKEMVELQQEVTSLRQSFMYSRTIISKNVFFS